VAAGEAVRPAGEDVHVGDVMAEPGTVLTPGHLGVLANQGTEEVPTYPRPRVGVLSTGDELVSGPGPLAPGQIRDANRRTLLGMVRREGWDAVDFGIVGDDEVALADVLDRASLVCDAIVTSGGVSVGDLDIVKVVLEKRSGGTMRWMQVAIRPAKPFAFGTLEGSQTPVFGLPGNPVSAMVSFELFVRPGIRQIAGHRSLHRIVVSATADTELRRAPDGKIHFIRALASLDDRGEWRLRPMAGQDSHQLLAMAEANALAVLPDGDGIDPGGRVDVLLTDPDRLSADVAAGRDQPW
jgi:molybdenum cofactor synthesis domain-containing protein